MGNECARDTTQNRALGGNRGKGMGLAWEDGFMSGMCRF